MVRPTPPLLFYCWFLSLQEILVRKKSVHHLDGRQKSLVDDALYSANPPDVSAATVVVRPPLQAYIYKLIHKDLNKRTVEKVYEHYCQLLTCTY